MITSTFSSNYAAVKVGKIKKINTDGTYDITFNDGDERINTPLDECMISQQLSDDIRGNIIAEGKIEVYNRNITKGAIGTL